MNRPPDPRAAAASGGATATLRVEHLTESRYHQRVAVAEHIAHLHPLEDATQSVLQHELLIEPAPSHRHEDRDAMGNWRQTFSIDTAHDVLLVRARSLVRVREPAIPPDPRKSLPWERVAQALRYVAGRPYEPECEFAFASPFVPLDARLRQYALESFPPDRPVHVGAIDLMHRIHADFRYDTASTEVSTPLLEAFEARAGVCQDFAHAMIGCLRSLGLAARYVSGYLRTKPPGGADALVGADASHAWVSAWCPEQGWIELDPTNDVIPALLHVRLARGRDYGDVAPLRGVVHGGGEHELRVAVRVEAAGG